MADFDDLIRQSQPAFCKNSPAGFTAGTSWSNAILIEGLS